MWSNSGQGESALDPGEAAPGAAIVRAAVLTATGLTLLIWTWGKLGDARIDWPKELHVAWRVSEGAVLYRDVEYLYGPLPVWINALWFMLLGTSIRTLALCNAAILALITLLLDRILRRFARPWAALGAGVVFLALFGFGNSVGFSNYNYLTPYAHGMTHGTALLLLAVWAMIRWMESPRSGWMALAGAAGGLTVFTKPEIALAAAATLGMGVIAVLWMHGTHRRSIRAAVLAFAGGLTLALAIFFGFMLIKLAPHDALRGTFASYLFSFDEQIRSTKFYRFGLGIEHPPRSLTKMAVWCSYYGRLLVPAALAALLLGRLAARHARGSSVILILALFSGMATFWIVWQQRFAIRWEDAFRGLGAICVIIVLVLAGALWRGMRRGLDARPIAAAFIFAILATALLAKMALNVRIYQYGFVLAMPCVMIVLVALLDWVPKLLNRGGGDGRIFTTAALGLVAAVVVVHLYTSSQVMARKNVQLAGGGDTIWSGGEEGQMLKAALDELSARARSDQTLAVLPEAAIFNYLLRMRNPTPFDQLTPISARVFGEQRIARAFAANPPDWIVLAHQDTAVFGPRHLGSDYLQELGKWMRANYSEVWRRGGRPLEEMQFGISILQRIDDVGGSGGE